MDVLDDSRLRLHLLTDTAALAHAAVSVSAKSMFSTLKSVVSIPKSLFSTAECDRRKGLYFPIHGLSWSGQTGNIRG